MCSPFDSNNRTGSVSLDAAKDDDDDDGVGDGDTDAIKRSLSDMCLTDDCELND